MDQPLLIWGHDLRFLEFYVSLIGTFATATIAAFAGRIAYLQANGKKPILLLDRHHVDAKNAPPGFIRVSITHQIWNRRTYAVRVNAYRIAFDNSVVRPASETKQIYLTSATNVIGLDNSEVVEAGKMAALTAEFLLNVGAIESVKEPYAVRLDLFEPMGWRRKKQLYSREMFHPANQFEPSLCSLWRRCLSRIWVIGRRIENSDGWVSETGQTQETRQVFSVWKDVFNAQIHRST